jgi:adhesin transport system membrane fusion protein
MNQARQTSPFPRSDPSITRTVTGLRLGIWGGAFALALFVLWSAFAEVDQVTRGQGQIIASSRTQVIQSSDGGVLDALLVREGDEVQRGQVLARLERTKADASYREIHARLGALSAAVSRLNSEVFGTPLRFNTETQNYPEFRANQTALLRKRSEAIDQEIDAMKRMRSIARRELEMTEPLLQSGDVSMADVLRLQRQVAELEGQITNRRNKYLQDCLAELTKTEEDLTGVRQTLVQRQDQVSNTEIVTPLRGKVKNVRVTTRGGVLRPGDELMQIVPLDDALLVEAKVKPSDVAFLRPGQEVNVKIDAYDYTVYGSLKGRLTLISADTISEDTRQGEPAYYRVQVQTESPRFSRRPQESLQLQPGMVATVEVRNGSSTVLNYLLKPLIKTLNESLGER